MVATVLQVVAAHAPKGGGMFATRASGEFAPTEIVLVVVSMSAMEAASQMLTYT
jgi:hypothetical protein